MNHAAALGDCAYAAGLAAKLELTGELLLRRVCGHNRLGCVRTAVRFERFDQRGHRGVDGLDGQDLPDHARRSDDDVVLVNARIAHDEAAHLLRLLHAVGVAGIGVAAVADYRTRVTVGDMRLGDCDRRALDLVARIDAGSRRAAVADDEREVALALVLSDSAMHACGFEALRRAHASHDFLHLKMRAERGPIRSPP